MLLISRIQPTFTLCDILSILANNFGYVLKIIVEMLHLEVSGGTVAVYSANS